MFSVFTDFHSLFICLCYCFLLLLWVAAYVLVQLVSLSLYVLYDLWASNAFPYAIGCFATEGYDLFPLKSFFLGPFSSIWSPLWFRFYSEFATPILTRGKEGSPSLPLVSIRQVFFLFLVEELIPEGKFFSLLAFYVVIKFLSFFFSFFFSFFLPLLYLFLVKVLVLSVIKFLFFFLLFLTYLPLTLSFTGFSWVCFNFTPIVFLNVCFLGYAPTHLYWIVIKTLSELMWKAYGKICL